MEPDRPVVLCVDDESSILRALRRVFMDEPWELLFAESGEAGLDLISERGVDLVLSDFRMPGMDGVTFLKRAKAMQPDCMRIVLSGYADINLIISALNEGEIYRFVAKPWNDEELVDNIRKALEHGRLDCENRQLAEQLRALNAGLERKVEERTRELVEKNRTLGFARTILEVLPIPVLGVDVRATSIFANAKARELLEPLHGTLVGCPAPGLFEPELTGTIQRASASGDRADHVMPMVLDGVAVGTIILVPGDATVDLEPLHPRVAPAWTVPPELGGNQ